MVDWIGGELGLAVWVLVARCSTRDPVRCPVGGHRGAVGGELHISTTVSQRAGRVWRLDTYVALVSIFHVIGYVKETKSPQLEGVD